MLSTERPGIICINNIKIAFFLSSHCGSGVTNLASIHEAGLIPGLAQWVEDPALPGAVV